MSIQSQAPEKRRSTLRDVARESGVSISTVSRAFSNPEKLSPATVAHVKDVANRLRFRPNVLARALITRTSPNVGLVVPDISNPYMTTLLKSAQAVSRRRDTGIFVADTDDSVSIEREVCDQLARQCRGLVLAAPRMSATLLRGLAESVPVVLVNRVVRGIPSVSTDSTSALGELVDDLVAQGHRSIAYVGGPTGSWADRQRARAVTDRCATAGAALTILGPTSASLQDGRAQVPALIASGATAVIAFDDVLACGLLAGLRAQGLQVPGDVSVVGHDDVLAELSDPALTTIAAHSARVGAIAVQRLLDLTEPDADVTAGGAENVEATLVRRSSTAPPRR